MGDLFGNLFGYQKKSEARANVIIGTLTGLLLGAAAGLLLAPQSGKETREDIVRLAEKGYEKAVEASQTVADFVKDKSQEVSEKFIKRKAKTDEDIADVTDEVTEEA
ncbi:MAG TPA: YtxH domain-containing protein [Clostridiaceae bacterium]|jgi:gas vesicle protein|nr:YtxH domain-containing protein [Clostridiaceae bacterium]